MKISLSVAVLILAIGVSLGWRDHRQIVASRATHGQLVAQAATLGISIDPAQPARPGRSTQRERDQRGGQDIKRVAAEFIAFAREMEGYQARRDQPDAAVQKRMMEFMDRMLSLDAAQLKVLIAEVRSSNDLKDQTRQDLVGFAIMSIANDHPQGALALFAESSDIFKDSGTGGRVIASALTRWAKDDPLAALAWVRDHADQYPDLINTAKRGLLTGAAAQDPKLAFKLMGELSPKDSSNDVATIVGVAKTPQQRTATLAALRDYLATLPDDAVRKATADSGTGMLVQGVARDGFESASRWLATAKLTPQELEPFATVLANSNAAESSEAGQWIEWLGANLPTEKGRQNIQNMVSQWTRTDYQAAGKWLAATPASPAKNISISSYAETIASYEPATAAQWALTLPAGAAREATLLNIYRMWPRTDPAGAAAAAAFAKQHGIE